MNSLVCCFCTQSISGDAAVEIAAPLEDGGVQALWAHGACLGARVHPSIPTLLPSTPERSPVAFLAITEQGLATALRLAEGGPVWCGVDAISERSFEDLSGNLTRFSYSLRGGSSEVVSGAVATIQEHHPGMQVWAECEDGL